MRSRRARPDIYLLVFISSGSLAVSPEREYRSLYFFDPCGLEDDDVVDIVFLPGSCVCYMSFEGHLLVLFPAIPYAIYTLHWVGITA
jgi:hypothetical protein